MDENELAHVNHLADQVVANAILQHPDHPQDSVSVSSETSEFFRAQGPPINLELPLPNTTGRTSADRTLMTSNNDVQSFDSDYQVREMGNRLGLHACSGPMPSVQMLLENMASLAKEALLLLPMKNPAPSINWNFVPSPNERDTWLLAVDNPAWGNNAEASTSTGYRRPRLQLIRTKSSLSSDSDTIMENASEDLADGMGVNNNGSSSLELVEYRHDFAVSQIMRNLNSAKEYSAELSDILETSGEMEFPVSEMEMDNLDIHTLPDIDEIIQEASPYEARRKRKSRAETPLVDDEVRRSSRFRKGDTGKHIMLDREPRRKKGEANKTVSFSVVEDLKKAIICRSLDTDMEEADMVEPIQSSTLVDLGTSRFCGVPPEEHTLATLEPSEE